VDTQKYSKQNMKQKSAMCTFQSVSGYDGTRMVPHHSFIKTTAETVILFG